MRACARARARNRAACARRECATSRPRSTTSRGWSGPRSRGTGRWVRRPRCPPCPPGSLVLLDKTHRGFLAGSDDERVVVVDRLVQLESGACEIIELVGALPKSRCRLGQRGRSVHRPFRAHHEMAPVLPLLHAVPKPDRKSTRLNSSHRCISYAVFCLKKKKKNKTTAR